jgi:phosphatidylglycerophosphatase A
MGIPIDTNVPGHQSADADDAPASWSPATLATPTEAPRVVEPGEGAGRSVLDPLARAIAVVGGCGLAPLAPGTVGALAGVVAFVAVTSGLRAAGVSPSLSLAVHGGLLLLLCVVGTWAAGRAERIFGRHDDGRIVIDEVAGQWVALLPVAVLGPLGPAAGVGPVEGAVDSVESLLFSGAVVTAFVLFRVFDVWKPGWVRWAERRFDGGWGVMADDLVAGTYAAVLLLALVIVLPGTTSDSTRLPTPVERAPAVYGEGVGS